MEIKNRVVLLATIDPNRRIYFDGKGPWFYTTQLGGLASLTNGNTVLMDAHVFDLVNGPMVNRYNAVLTDDKFFIVREMNKNVERKDPVTLYCAHPMLDVLKDLSRKIDEDETIYIVSTGTLIEEAMKYADEMVITELHDEKEGFGKLPEILPEQWETSLICNVDLAAKFTVKCYTRVS